MSSVQPKFCKSRADLLARLRLSGASGSADAGKAIDSAIQAASLGLQDRLGDTLVAEILLTDYTDSPSTSEERKRLRAALTEEKWVKHDLVRSMPILFQQVADEDGARWNEEEYASGQEFSKQRELSRLWDEVIAGIDALTEGSGQPEVYAGAIGPETTPVYRPGGSVLPPDLRETDE